MCPKKSAYLALIAFEPFYIRLDLVDNKIGCVARRARAIQHQILNLEHSKNYNNPVYRSVMFICALSPLPK